MNNKPLSAFFSSIKSLFGPKQPLENPDPLDIEANITPPMDRARQNASSYTRLQSLPSPKHDGPAFNRQSHDQMYQASKGGASATQPARRTSSTFTKLQALSASGTGSAANEPVVKDNNLNSLLDRLEQE